MTAYRIGMRDGATLESLLYRKPTNRLPHTGGERIRQGSESRRNTAR